MSAPWFYLSELPELPGEVELDADEASHARGARRLAEGDPVVLFDGRGHTATGVLTAATRREARIRVEARRHHPRPGPAIHLASALPKGDRQAILLSMTTQLGMAGFTPLHCTHSVARPGDGAARRWSRILRESCKQSRMPYLPVLEAEQRPEALVAGDGSGATGTLVVLDPAGQPARDVLDRLAEDRPAALRLVVGPEAGLSGEERERLADAGARLIALPTPILRIETAAVAGLAILAILTPNPSDATVARGSQI